MNESNPHTPSKIVLAKWSERFFAWLIDFIIISSISTVIIFASFDSIEYELEENSFWMENIQYIPTSVLFFIYWTILEYKTSQTIGKKIMNLKIINIDGRKPNLKGIMISSFGKAFFLPIDVILGWFLTNEKRQRIFNKLGDTLIVKIREVDDVSDIKYLKD
jgi:uncharacterized RDD family membrane protein YckC